MANEIKELFSTTGNFSITLSGLASSTTGLGRQSAMVDNSVIRAQRAYVFVKIAQGAATANRGAYVYGIRGDGISRDDVAGTGDAQISILNAPLLGSLINKSSVVSGDVIQGWFIFDNPGKEFGIAVYHDTVAALSPVEANHGYKYVLANPEVQ